MTDIDGILGFITTLIPTWMAGWCSWDSWVIGDWWQAEEGYAYRLSRPYGRKIMYDFSLEVRNTIEDIE